MKDWNSVTRWLVHLFHIDHLHQWKFAQKQKIAKDVSIYFSNTKVAKDFLKFAKLPNILPNLVTLLTNQTFATLTVTHLNNSDVCRRLKQCDQMIK